MFSAWIFSSPGDSANKPDDVKYAAVEIKKKGIITMTTYLSSVVQNRDIRSVLHTNSELFSDRQTYLSHWEQFYLVS